MKNLKRLFLAAALCTGLSAQGSDWSRGDTIRETAVVTLAVADWMQTLDIKNHWQLHEANPLLGDHPTRGQVNLYFAASIGLHILIARMLPPAWRKAFQYVSVADEACVVGHNLKLGVRFSF